MVYVPLVHSQLCYPQLLHSELCIAVHSQLCYPPRYTIFYPDFTDYKVASSLRSLNDNDATVLTARAPCIISLTATKVFSFYVLLLNFAILIALNVCLISKEI